MRTVLAILISLIIANVAFSQAKIGTNEVLLNNPSLFDARAHSLGKCEIMAATGSNAIFSNPANIAGLKEINIQISSSAKFGRLENTLWNSHSYSGDEITGSYKLQTLLSQFSTVLPLGNINDKIVFTSGVGINKYLDFSEEFVIETQDYRNTIVEKETHKYSGGLYFLTPTIAFQLFDRFNFGFTYHRSLFGEKEHFIEEYSHHDVNLFLDIREKMEASFYSFGTNFQILNNFALGFMYRSEMEIEMQYAENRSYSTGPSIDPSWIDKDDYAVTIPEMYGVGGSLKLFSSTTLYGEYQYRNWSDSKRRGHNYYFIDDGRFARVGLETKLNDTFLRVGYYNDSIPITNYIESDYEYDTEPILQSGITYGIGFNSGLYLIELGGDINWFKFDRSYINEPPFFTNGYESRKTMFEFFASISYFLE